MGTRNHPETGIFPQVNLIFQFDLQPGKLIQQKLKLLRKSNI